MIKSYNNVPVGGLCPAGGRPVSVAVLSMLGRRGEEGGFVRWMDVCVKWQVKHRTNAGKPFAAAVKFACQLLWQIIIRMSCL